MKPTLETITLFISVFTFMGGLLMWYSGTVTKRYAAQRDFEHLKASYKQLAGNQEAILRELDQRFDQLFLELKELKAHQMAVFARFGGENSTGWYRKPE